MLLEGALVEQLEAEGACEVFRMPLLAHRSDAPACVVERVLYMSQNACTMYTPCVPQMQ